MHPLEWPKSGTWTTSNSDEDVEHWELSFIAGGRARWHSGSPCSLEFGSFLQN